MLQIRLSRGPSAESGGGTKSLPVETVTVACPDHLVLADLPVAKSLGSVTAGSLVKTVGRRSRRHLGERVHFCVRCDFPIAIYGRLSPCEHAFCLDCARSDSICYLCDERIQKIQTIKMMEGIFICAAPHCLKSFLKKTEFESHIHENHANLLQPNVEKDDANESEAQSGIKQPTASESSVKASMRPAFSPSTHSQPQRSQPREPPLPRPITQSRPSPHFGQGQNQPSEEQAADSRPPGFERRAGAQNRFSQQAVDMQGGLQQESTDKQQDLSSDTQFPSFPPQHPQQPPNFGVPINSNPPFSYPTFPPEGVQPFYPESGSGQGSLLGFPPGPVASPNFPESYQRPWNAGPTGLPLETPVNGQGTADASLNSADSQRGGFFQGDYGRSPGGFPMNPSSSPLLDKGMERQGSNVMDPQSSTLPPPPPLPPPQASQIRGKAYSGDMGRDGPGYGWQHERRDGFRTGHD